VNKKKTSGQRVKNVSQLKRVFAALGSNLNPTLTQLAKTRRVVFVEGLDFQVFGIFARVLRYQRVANRADFAVVRMDGFNPKRAIDLAAGIEATLGSCVARAVVLDRDYRSHNEIEEIRKELLKHGFIVRVHGRKEMENYLLNATVLERAVEGRLVDRAQRLGEQKKNIPDISQLIEQATNEVRHDVFAQIQAREVEFVRKKNSYLDMATITADISKRFEVLWESSDGRLSVAPGKEVLARVNTRLQASVGVSVSDGQIAVQFRSYEVHSDIRDLVEELSSFSASEPKD
jgi:hypothetical protein